MQHTASFLAIILAVGTAANADPIRVTSGSAGLNVPENGSLSFDLRANQLHLKGAAFGDEHDLVIDEANVEGVHATRA